MSEDTQIMPAQTADAVAAPAVLPPGSTIGPSGFPFAMHAAPFDDAFADADFFFPANQHVEALAFMGRAIWTRERLAVVTAEDGCGKSTLARHLLRDLDERVVVAYVNRTESGVGPRQFLLDILRQFGFTLDDDDRTDRRRLIERFLRHQVSMGRVCLLIVENAQSMHPFVLEELRLLALIEAEGAPVLKLVLLGEPSLNHVLDSQRMSECLKSAHLRYSVPALTEEQSAAYIAHRLRASGSQSPQSLIPHVLMPQIHACTGGVPAKINALCAQAIGIAAHDGATGVALAHLDQAIHELELTAFALPSIVTATGEKRTVQRQSKLTLSLQGMADTELVVDRPRMLVGRCEDADVRIDSVFVSRYHALIVRDADHDLLLDLGSTNSLLVNSRRVARRALRDNDLIQIGPAKLRYHCTQTEVAVDKIDPAETLSFVRPGFPGAAGEEDQGAVLAFGRDDGPVKP